MDTLRLSTTELSDVDLESQTSPGLRSESPEIETTHKYTQFDQPKETHPPAPPESTIEAPTVVTVHQVQLVAVRPPEPPKTVQCVLKAVTAIVVYYLLAGYVGKLLLWAIDAEFSHRFGAFWTIQHYLAFFLISLIGAVVFGCSRGCTVR